MSEQQKKPVIISAAIIEMEDKILIAKRPKDKKLANKWEFPGGKLEQGETIEQCLKREVLEELGIEVKINSHFMDVPCQDAGDNACLKAFRCSVTQGKPQAIEHADLAWVTRDELDSFDWPDADIPIIKALQTIL
jgi:8-oxo-dGTP diphosphatase